MVNSKFILFLLVHFNSFFNNYMFFKFINKFLKDILRCTPPSSHVCDFIYVGVKCVLKMDLLNYQNVVQEKWSKGTQVHFSKMVKNALAGKKMRLE